MSILRLQGENKEDRCSSFFSEQLTISSKSGTSKTISFIASYPPSSSLRGGGGGWEEEINLDKTDVRKKYCANII